MRKIRFISGLLATFVIMALFQTALAADTQQPTQQETQVVTQQATQMVVQDFPDVAKDNANYTAIMYLRAKGIIGGYPDGTFKPNQVVNRVEALKMILGIYKIEPQAAMDSGSNADFLDVTDLNAWYFPYLNRAVNESIVSGYPDSTFKPANTVNLVEALKILINSEEVARLLKLEAASSQSFSGTRGELQPVVLENITVTSNPYADAMMSEWYAKYVQYAKDKGLLDADAANKVMPAQGMTRAKLAELVYRVLYTDENGLSSYGTFHQDYEATSGVEFKLNDSSGIGGIAIVTLAKAVADQLTANNEVISSFYAPKDLQNVDLIYLSTEANTGTWSPQMKSTNNVYSYNTKTEKLTLLYTESESRLLRTLGMEGNKLVMMNDGIDNSPGPCFSVWSDWDSYSYLDITNAAAGLKPYTMPEYMVVKGQLESADCAKNM